MRVIKPKKFDSSMLISTNAVEAYPNFSMSTTYAKGARVVCTLTFRLYESLVNSNLGNQPCWGWGIGLYPAYSSNYSYAISDIVEYNSKLYKALASGTLGTPPSSQWELIVTDYSEQKWVDIGPSNKYAMFDEQVSTQTTSSGTLTVDLSVGFSNSLALVGLKGSTVTIVTTTGSTQTYSATFSLDAAIITDWYQYYFEENTPILEVSITEIPPYSNTRVLITVAGLGEVAIGNILFGTSYFLGDTEYGATAGIVDYSTKETDEFGTTTFVQRGFAKRMSARLMLDNVQLRRVQTVLSEVRATPCVWIGTDDQTYSPLVVYGFYREFSLEISYPTKSYCSLDVEGLT